MFRWSRGILLAAGFGLLIFGQTQRPSPQKEPPQSAASNPASKNQNASKSESLLEWVLRVTGISATSRGLKGDHPPLLSGELWIVDVSTLLRSRVAMSSDCRTPVFADDDKSILALCRGGLMQISLESTEAHELGKAPAEVERLLAVDRTSEPDHRRIVVVTAHRLSMFAPVSSGLSTLGIPSGEDPDLITSLEEEPQYGSVRLRSLFSGETAGGKRGAEIFMETDSTSKQLTQCAPRKCGQGALSHDGKTVAFVRSEQ